MHQLSFTRGHSDADRDASITVPVALRSGAKVADLIASFDTGASQCLFENAYAAELVYFFAEPSIRKNVLGRGGWLDRVAKV